MKCVFALTAFLLICTGCERDNNRGTENILKFRRMDSHMISTYVALYAGTGANCYKGRSSLYNGIYTVDIQFTLIKLLLIRVETPDISSSQYN